MLINSVLQKYRNYNGFNQGRPQKNFQGRGAFLFKILFVPLRGRR